MKLCSQIPILFKHDRVNKSKSKILQYFPPPLTHQSQKLYDYIHGGVSNLWIPPLYHTFPNPSLIYGQQQIRGLE